MHNSNSCFSGMLYPVEIPINTVVITGVVLKLLQV